LWILAKRSKLLPDGGGCLDLTALAGQMAEAVQFTRQAGAMTRTAAASRLWHEVYPRLAAERSGLVGAITGRAEAQVLRLSMVYALSDQCTAIDVMHLKAALAFWRYCDESACLIFEGTDPETDGDPLAARLPAVIRASPNGLTRRDLHKALCGHVPAKELVAALAKLRDRGLVRRTEKETGGRKAECWFPREAACERSEQSEQRSTPPTVAALCSAGSPRLPPRAGSSGEEALPL